jgi:cytoskeletal protein CcmA (bactofilin family)
MRSDKTPDKSAVEIPLSQQTDAPAVEETQRADHSHRSSVPSVISPGLTVKGNLESVGEIQIDGDVEGDIKGKSIVVGEGAAVKGSVLGDSVTVAGTVEGKVEGMTVNIQKTARLTGDIIHQALEIESGAYVDGRCSPHNGKAEFSPAAAKAGASTLKAVSEDEKKSEEAVRKAG